MESINKILQDNKELTHQRIAYTLDITNKFFQINYLDRILYNKLINNYQQNKFKKIDKDYIEDLYLVLISWGMNCRGANLSDFENFNETLTSDIVTEMILKLRKIDICDLEDEETKKYVKLLLKTFFKDITLLENDSPRKSSRFVTYSKTLHLLLPHLIAPMDRAYILKYYKMRVSPDNIQKDFKNFIQIQEDYWKFILDNYELLNEFIDKTSLNRTLPKICDNIIIGQCILEKPIITGRFKEPRKTKGIDSCKLELGTIDSYFSNKLKLNN